MKAISKKLFVGPLQPVVKVVKPKALKPKVDMPLEAKPKVDMPLETKAGLSNPIIKSISKDGKEYSYKAPMNMSIGAFIEIKIHEGLGNKEILALVHERTGNQNTSYGCVAWYRNRYNKMKLAGKI